MFEKQAHHHIQDEFIPDDSLDEISARPECDDINDIKKRLIYTVQLLQEKFNFPKNHPYIDTLFSVSESLEKREITTQKAMGILRETRIAASQTFKDIRLFNNERASQFKNGDEVVILREGEVIGTVIGFIRSRTEGGESLIQLNIKLLDGTCRHVFASCVRTVTPEDRTKPVNVRGKIVLDYITKIIVRWDQLIQQWIESDSCQRLIQDCMSSLLRDYPHCDQAEERLNLIAEIKNLTLRNKRLINSTQTSVQQTLASFERDFSNDEADDVTISALHSRSKGLVDEAKGNIWQKLKSE